MAHRTPAAVVAAVLVLAACSDPEYGADDPAPSAAASATTSSPAPAATVPPGITDSAQLSEPVAVRGVITRPGGAPVVDALVQLVTEPADEQPATGGAVATARTGADGAYELRIAAELRAALPADDAGLVGFAVVVDSPDGAARTSWTGPAELTHPHSADLEVVPDG
ncbi:carboxypeptidase-like regulatory domain-containing protein [Jiangella muralis]|uniref:carboxypeptidase-like regulatory domain-containing protein n=1 Tax=Jiangella muralis TaxID=702383 RepID=UPI00069D5179|nr:carboxypeptidase-like regulatory domain-containing protein [Jiangella muralis]